MLPKILNLVSFTQRSKLLFGPFHKCSFSNYSANFDPYYILGVDKTAEFKQIKKAFFKLANQYHPDKNKQQDASVKFLKAKQAFEAIKMQKGLMKPQNFVESTQHDSVRPNPEQFMSDQEQSHHSNQDYRVFRQKAQGQQGYEKFHGSFKTIHDIKDIKIKVQQGKMKDAASRFKLSQLRINIKFMSETSSIFVFICGIGIFGIMHIMSQQEDQSEKKKRKDVIVSESILIQQQRTVMKEQYNNATIYPHELVQYMVQAENRKSSGSGLSSTQTLQQAQQKKRMTQWLKKNSRKEKVAYSSDQNVL